MAADLNDGASAAMTDEWLVSQKVVFCSPVLIFLATRCH